MSTDRRFTQLDVFTAPAPHGNALAAHDAQDLDDARLAACAACMPT